MLRFYPDNSAKEIEIRQHAQKHSEKLRQTALHDDEKSFFNKEVFRAICKDKLNCISLPTEYGGLGQPSQSFYGVIEELSKASPAMAIVVGVTNLIQGAISQFGTSDQKKEYLTKLISGEWLGAFSLSESGSGSDAASLKLSAKKEKDGYLLNGTKLWCSNAGYADCYLVMARTSEQGAKGITSFLVKKDQPGFKVGKQEKKLGLRSSSLAELVFENCFIEEKMRLAEEGQGFTVALSQLDSGRISIGTCGLGIAIEVLEKLSSLGLPEGDLEELSTYYARAQSIRSMILHGSEYRDRKESITALASMIKLLGSDLAMEVTSFALTILGAPGQDKTLGIERLFRDAKALQIVEGTNQIQKKVLSRFLK
jgi:alkylation response protein AidB-like acyl-CoA dehydrogenase